MRVKISHTVDYDDVPKHAQNLVSDIKNNLNIGCEQVSFRPDDVQQMMVNCQSALDKISLATSQIQDLLSITIGWVDAANQGFDLEDNEEEQGIADE